MSEIVGKMQVKLKQSSSDLFLFLLKLVTGLVLGLTFALVIHEVLGKKEGEGTLPFTLMLVVFTAVFLRVAKKWSWVSV